MKTESIQSLNALFQGNEEINGDKKSELEALAWRYCQAHNPTSKHSIWQKLGLRSLLLQSMQSCNERVVECIEPQWVTEPGVHYFWVDGVYREDLSQQCGNIQVKSDLEPRQYQDWQSWLQGLPQQEVTAAMALALCSQWHRFVISGSETVHRHHILTGNVPVVAVNQQCDVESGVALEMVTHLHVLGDEPVVLLSNRGMSINACAVVSEHCINQVPAHIAILGAAKTTVGQDSSYQNHQMITGGQVVRGYHQVDLNGKQAYGGFHGVCLGRDCDKLDQVILMKHNAKYTRSEQSYKNVARDKAMTGFSSRVYVSAGVSDIDSQQLNHNLLVDKGAKMVSLPELEIYADEVSCAHGSTIGQIDEKSLFYMRSRGLSHANAQALLIKGFIDEKIIDFPESVQDKAFAMAHQYLDT